MATLIRNAITRRSTAIRPVVDAYDKAETTEEKATAAADLLAVTEAADENYSQERKEAVLALARRPEESRT